MNNQNVNEVKPNEEAKDKESVKLSTSPTNDYLLAGISINLQESKCQSIDLSSLQLDPLHLESKIDQLLKSKIQVSTFNLSCNQLNEPPPSLKFFTHLTTLDVSENLLTSLNLIVNKLTSLRVLIACNNRLDQNSFPKELSSAYAAKLEVLNLSGNQFQSLPNQLFHFCQLQSLYLGGNKIELVSKNISKLSRLRFLYLGGNQLQDIPSEIGLLTNLEVLSLCENQLTQLPSSVAQLTKLKTLSLHKNQLTTLPTAIVKLASLNELSIRSNPLVNSFIRDLIYNPPTLLELAARCIKINKIDYPEIYLCRQLRDYLKTAQRCVNPKCKGVYFDTRIEHIKFVDFCGVYRLPLLQYLCSPCCSDKNPAVNDSSKERQLMKSKMKKVLLG